MVVIVSSQDTHDITALIYCCKQYNFYRLYQLLTAIIMGLSGFVWREVVGVDMGRGRWWELVDVWYKVGPNAQNKQVGKYH